MRTCAHLARLEEELDARGLAVAPTRSPYGEETGTWYECDCTLDGAALSSRLALPACVSYLEYDGRVAGSDATFTCNECKVVVMGLHPRYAPPGTPKLS